MRAGAGLELSGCQRNAAAAGVATTPPSPAAACRGPRCAQACFVLHTA